MQAILLDDQGNQYPLDQGSQWTVGSKERNPSIIIGGVSPEDGVLEINFSDEGYLLSPASALSPVLVNGEKLIEPTILSEGDMIQMGAKKLSFSKEALSGELSEEEDLLSAYDEIGHETDDTPTDETEPEEPLAEEPLAEEPLAEEPLAEEPLAEEPLAEEPLAEEPLAEEPLAEEPLAEGPLAEELVAEEPVAEEPVAEEPVAEEPVAEEPVAEEPVAEEPVAEEPVAEEPVAKEPVAEEPVAEEPVAEDSKEDEIYTPLSGMDSEHIEYNFDEEERWLLKILSGPSKGAEFPLKETKKYTIGHNPESCDVIIFDLSVSSKHAELELMSDQKVFLTDLSSRNGTFIGNEKVEAKTEISSHQVFTVGTTTILVLDTEADAKTIVAEIPDHLKEEEKDSEELKSEEKASEEEEKKEAEALHKEEERKRKTSKSILIFTIAILVFLAFIGFGTKALFSGKEISLTPPDQIATIKQSLVQFTSVEFSYNKTTGKIFILGHLSSQLEESQLMYELGNLNFIKEISNKVIIDENIWTEQNALLSSDPRFEGVSMHAPRPGLFVINGYVKTAKDNDGLINFLNLHFSYLDLLENRVIVIQELNKQIVSFLLQDSLNGITFQLDYGDVTLFGFAQEKQRTQLQRVSQKVLALKGVRFIKNLVVFMSQDSSALNISNKYKVSGYSKHGNINVNVVINGQIYARGDQIDGMTITGIRPDKIFLEKHNMKYMIDYHFSPTEAQ